MDGATIAIIIVAVIIILVISLVGYYISKRNQFIRYEQDVENSLSRIDVFLTKRFDLLTKMVETTKGYAKHEQETLTKVIGARNISPNSSLKEKAEFDGKLNEVARQLNLVVERYPELKADSLFKGLQSSISEVEENLQAARSNYNANVSEFNKAILQFPGSLIAGSRFTKKDYFEADEQKKQDVKIEF